MKAFNFLHPTSVIDESLFLKVVLNAFVLGGVLFLILPISWFPAFYAPRFMGLGALFFVALMQSPRWLFRPSNAEQRWAVQHLQHAIALGLVLSSLGELGLWQLYRVGFEYDKLVHIAFPFFVTAALAPVLHYRYQWSVRTSIFTSIGTLLLIGVFWEYAEFYNDRLFGTQFFGVYGADVYRDTILDLTCNLLGGVSAALVMAITHPRWSLRS